MLSMERQKLETIKNALLGIGYSIEEVEIQIEEVGKLMTMAILHKLLKKHDYNGKLTPEGLKIFLKERYNSEYLKLVIEEESDNIIQEYLKEISLVLNEEKRNSLYKAI